METMKRFPTWDAKDLKIIFVKDQLPLMLGKSEFILTTLKQVKFLLQVQNEGLHVWTLNNPIDEDAWITKFDFAVLFRVRKWFSTDLILPTINCINNKPRLTFLRL